MLAGGLSISGRAAVSEQTNKLFTEAEAVYAKADYVNASSLFLDVATAAVKQDLKFAQRALERAGDSVCLAQLDGASALLKDGLTQRAEIALDGALDNPHCARFGDKLKWARQQKARLASADAKRKKTDRPR